jgi:predicted phosphodiesterase
LKYAIISDLHANLEAVEACFAEIENLKADRIICLGDLVDYCAQPIEVIQLVQDKCNAVVLGNHDEAQFNHPLSESENILHSHTQCAESGNYKLLPFAADEALGK